MYVPPHALFPLLIFPVQLWVVDCPHKLADKEAQTSYDCAVVSDPHPCIPGAEATSGITRCSSR